MQIISALLWGNNNNGANSGEGEAETALFNKFMPDQYRRKSKSKPPGVLPAERTGVRLELGLAPPERSGVTAPLLHTELQTRLNLS